MNPFTILKPDFPFALQIEITSHCNLKCKMCPLTTEKTASSIHMGHISAETWAQILPMAQKAQHVIFAGFGETLVNPQCLTYLEQLDRLGVTTSVTTNGTVITPALARKLVALKTLLQINVSIDSPDPQIYREIRGGDLAKALTGLKNLMAVIDYPDRVVVTSVLMHQNAASLVQFPPILAQMGVRIYVLQSLIDYNAECHDQNVLYHQEIDGHIKQLQAACQKAEIDLKYTLLDRLNLELNQPEQAQKKYYDLTLAEGETKQCLLPWELPFVDKDGKVFPCCYATLDETTILGDLRQDSLWTIWHSAPAQKFRQSLLSGKNLHPTCQSCTAVKIGKHLYHQYAANFLLDRCHFTDPQHMVLVAQNVGTETWYPETAVRIGTAHPRDCASPFYHRSWLTNNRVASFSEEKVPPGGLATFCFAVASKSVPQPLRFQLVVDGKTWLPNTRFEIAPDVPAIMDMATRASEWVQQWGAFF